MQTYDSLLFTPTEAAALTQLSVKTVNNAIDKKTVPAAIGRRSGHIDRALNVFDSRARERELLQHSTLERVNLRTGPALRDDKVVGDACAHRSVDRPHQSTADAQHVTAMRCEQSMFP
jgi:hypothetical protein